MKTMKTSVMKKYLKLFPEDIENIIKENIKDISIGQKFNKCVKKIKKIRYMNNDNKSKIKRIKEENISTQYYLCHDCRFLHIRNEFRFTKDNIIYVYQKESDDGFFITYIEKYENGEYEEIDIGDYMEVIEDMIENIE